MNDVISRHQKMVEQYPNNELARFSLGKALFDAGDVTSARVQFEAALARKPEWMVVQILIGKCDLASGDRASARRAFERGLKLAIEQHHEGPQAEMEELLRELGE